MPQDLPPLAPLPGLSAGEDGASDSLASDLLNNLSAAPTPPDPTPPAAPSEPTPKPAGGEPAPAPAKPTEPPKPAPAKPEPPKPAPTKPAAAKPVEPPKPAAPVNFDDPKLTVPELRKHLKEMQTNHQRTVAEKETALRQANERLSAMEKKRVWTDDDQKRWEELNAGKSALEAQLYSRNYAESPEYKKEYIDKINAQFGEAVDVAKSLKVSWTTKNEDGTETPHERPGTEQDMMRLYNSANNADRRKLAKELFGPDFQEALDAVAPMIATKKAADEAVKSKREGYQTEAQKQADEAVNLSGQVDAFIKQQHQNLATTVPELFAPTEGANEENDILTKGMDFVHQASAKAGTMSLPERAAKAALISAMAGAFPRLRFKYEAQKNRIAELEAELSGYRKSDPGNGGEGGGDGGGKTEEAGGTEELSKEFDNLPNAGV